MIVIVIVIIVMGKRCVSVESPKLESFAYLSIITSIHKL